MSKPLAVMFDFFSTRRAAAMALAAASAGCGTHAIERDAREQAGAGQWQAAIASLEQGLRDHPHSTALRAQLLRMREQAVGRHVVDALAARDAGRLADAERELTAALRIDARNDRVLALQGEIATERRQLQAVASAEELVAGRQSARALQLIDQALKDNPRHAGLVALKRRVESELRLATGFGTGMALAERRPISLDFRDAPLRLVLDAVTRHSGVDFIMDRDVRADQRVTVLIRNSHVEDALDLLTSTQQLARKVVDPNTVLIYPNTPEKHREYQEQVVRVFHLASADAKAAAAFLRSMLRIREPFVDERTNLLAVRDTPENIQLAERLITLFDSGEPEVLLEVEVLEVSASRLTDLGVKLPDSFSLTPIPPAGGLTLGNAGDINRNRLALGIGGVLVNLKREVGDFSTLANPRIRARNREKAKILIGDKIPIVTTTTGVGGFVAESISYLDVGLKLDVEPTVYPDDEVAIKLALEVSSVGSSVKTNAGSLAYQIGTRNASTLLRLRDGETQLLAGLISRDERRSASGWPGLMDLPVLGRLFASHTDQGLRTELLLAITPRILRNVRRPGAGESELWVGTEASPRLRRPQPVTSREGPTRGAEAAPATEQRAADASPPTPAPTTFPSTIQLAWRGPAEVAAGSEAVVQLLMPPGFALRGMPVELSFDPTMLRVLSVTEGDFFNRGPQDSMFTASVDSTAGRIRASSLRRSATAVDHGMEGVLLTVRIQALAPGATSLKLEGAQPVVLVPPTPAVAPSQWTVTVR